jgi:hypothetical protein
MFIYTICSIDNWYGWTPLTEVLDDALERADDRSFWLEHQELLDFWNTAQKLARAHGWEGDIRGGFGDEDGGPWFAPLPIDNSGETVFIIAWKQDNNGTTFVASSIPLPWLRSHSHQHALTNQKRAR